MVPDLLKRGGKSSNQKSMDQKPHRRESKSRTQDEPVYIQSKIRAIKEELPRDLERKFTSRSLQMCLNVCSAKTIPFLKFTEEANKAKSI